MWFKFVKPFSRYKLLVSIAPSFSKTVQNLKHSKFLFSYKIGERYTKLTFELASTKIFGVFIQAVFKNVLFFLLWNNLTVNNQEPKFIWFENMIKFLLSKPVMLISNLLSSFKTAFSLNNLFSKSDLMLLSHRFSPVRKRS